MSAFVDFSDSSDGCSVASDLEQYNTRGGPDDIQSVENNQKAPPGYNNNIQQLSRRLNPMPLDPRIEFREIFEAMIRVATYLENYYPDSVMTPDLQAIGEAVKIQEAEIKSLRERMLKVLKKGQKKICVDGLVKDEVAQIKKEIKKINDVWTILSKQNAGMLLCDFANIY